MKLSALRPASGVAKSLALLLSLAAVPAWAHDHSICPAFLAVDGAPAPAHRGEITFSPYTHHWTHSAEHKPVVLIAVDEHLPGNRFCGVSLFSNSFGQPSLYMYAGRRFNRVLGVPQLFVKLTAGILYGYVEPYNNKVPLNSNGFSPAIIPSLGYQISQKNSFQVKVLGSAGLMLSFARNF